MRLNDECEALLLNNALQLRARLYASLSPMRQMKTSEWATQNLFLSKEEGPEPGLYSYRDLPWQAEVMDALDDIEAESLVIKAASQVGKTTISKAIMGRTIDLDPCPILVVQSTQDAAKEYSTTRLKPMFRDCPVFKNKLTADDTYLKTFTGGYVAMAWSQSPTTLASKTIKVLLGDEIDRWPSNSGSEGDPLDIAKARTENYPDAKHAFVSSPTTADGRINVEYSKTNQNRFFVCCPHCGHEHVMDFLEQIRMINDDPNTAMLACPACAGLYGDADLPEMVRVGRFIPKFPERKKHVGFEISRLMVPKWTKLTDLAEKYLAAKSSTEQLQVFVNTQLGQVYVDKKGQISSAASLAARRENYDHTRIPDGVLFITAGVDVQKDRIELEIVGFGLNEESWGLQYIVLVGDPSENEVWRNLNEVLLSGFTTADGRYLRIAAACVDSSDNTQKVYEFCHGRTKRRIWATKGREGPLPIWPARPSRSKRHGKFQVRIIGVDTIKDTLNARFKKREGEAGYCHFPYTYDEHIVDAERDEEYDYFAQLTSERRKPHWNRSGKQYYSWVKEKHRRNEALDCRGYAWAAMVGLIQECRLNVAQLHEVKQLALFKGDPLSSGQALADEAPEPIMPMVPSRPNAEPSVQKKSTAKGAKGRRVVRSGYVRR